jgi:predicted ABC-type transport system involved in lysophospholipase L1 biosynthesis ATPase subunit
VEAGKTILMVTHDNSLARRMTRTLHLVNGSIERQNGKLIPGYG